MLPDDVLAAFKLPRAGADDLALRTVAAAAPSIPVFAASAVTLKPERDAWLRASAAAAHASIFDMDPAPVRLDVKGMGALDDETIAAMRLWTGPYEFVGAPDSKGKAALSDILAKPVISAYPLDPAAVAPLLWQYDNLEQSGLYVNGAVFSFKGVTPWKQTDLVLPAVGEQLVWRCVDGAFVDAVNQPIASPGDFTVYGTLPKPEHPSVMGLSTGIAAGLDQTSKVAWDAGSLTLSGQIKGPLADKTSLYVLVPDGWEFKKGEVGKEKVKGEMLGRRLAFPIGADGGAFNLEFKQGK
jgi:hypothetical protein